MRVVIDMQGVQILSCLQIRQRYIKFFQAVCARRAKNEILLVLDGSFTETVELLRKEFYEFLPQENIRVWFGLPPNKNYQLYDDQRNKISEIIREAFIKSLEPDVVHKTNLSFYDKKLPSSLSELHEGTLQTKSIHKLSDHGMLEFKSAEIAEEEFFFEDVEDISHENKVYIQHIKLPIVAADSWVDAIKTANIVINYWQDNISTSRRLTENTLDQKSLLPRLIYVSPMPPQKTGISQYSIELIKSLSQYYDIEVIVDNDFLIDTTLNDDLSIRDILWFNENVTNSDRVIYHIGNSPFHAYMLNLIARFPGVLVMHDFFLGHLYNYLGADSIVRELYKSHGFSAVVEAKQSIESAIFKYPCSFSVVQNAKGVITHSKFTQKLARDTYGNSISNKCRVVPLLRSEPELIEKSSAREQLGLSLDDFVICSFGFLGPTKLNERLLGCWMDSALAVDERCKLIFVGECNDDYQARLLEKIRDEGLGDRIKITGYVSSEIYRYYLTSADAAVQLRTESRGETSAAALDCMNYGLPLIVNANGSMAELRKDSVLMISNDFSDIELIDALENIRENPKLRSQISSVARKIISNKHSPLKCAKDYADAIETFYKSCSFNLSKLVSDIVEGAPKNSFINNLNLFDLSENLAINFPKTRVGKRLFIDVTVTCQDDYKTGIQRVVRAVLLEFLKEDFHGFRAEPVKLSDVGGKWHYRLASNYLASIFNFPQNFIKEEVIEPQAGDILLVLDLTGPYMIQAEKSGLYSHLMARGVRVLGVVYDLLPILHPNLFPEYAKSEHEKWLRSISTLNGAICISKVVASDLESWRKSENCELTDQRPFEIYTFNLGADLNNSLPTKGLPNESELILSELKKRPTFLMVGTVEPRKGHMEILKAFNFLWNQGIDVNLVVVGKEGWQGLPDNLRRNIPDTINSLRNHPESKHRLFWLDGVSDEYLDAIYKESTCLIAASYNEGYGLPLIEAAQYRLPIIARDIAVFREVAGSNAYYFKGDNVEDIVVSIREWLELYKLGQHPESNKILWITWAQSVNEIKSVIIRSD